MIEVVRDESVNTFLDEAGPLLYQNEPTNSLILGVAEGMLRSAPKIPPLLLRVLDNGQTISAAIQNRPSNLILSNGTLEGMEELSQFLHQLGASIPGVVGPSKEVEFFAKSWSILANQNIEFGMYQKLYKLEQVIHPTQVSGSLRTIMPSEVDLVTKWMLGFAAESLPPAERHDESYWKEFAEKTISNQFAHCWVVNDVPVALACISRPTLNGITINGVYTPVEYRKKGYASHAVARLSQKMLDSGKKFCVLYTDLANPTSNKIYQDIGYKEESDSKFYNFKATQAK
ncbi:GNAT family N-acetyltransferase [Peredibacter starrii]|uniref:GNAT family N-acetyltransferase n=1 Tax=Peredibacter starrii TaxID=28202 RepID=A0AAX4HT86_9BACT|nr:GNAT family N-acetyltransferase [Peredibacter starrii]WPU66613.1 GNAT family N-acetyltransferase [Peredibacter starrii]